MSISKAILKALNQRLEKPLSFGRRVLYVPLPVCFARGIGIEQTPYKNIVNVFLLRIAFFVDLPYRHRNYSPRLVSQQQSEFDDFFEGSPGEIADLIDSMIEREGLRNDLRTLPGPDEFLKIIAGSNVNPDRAGIVFDRACCQALLQQREEALRLFALADVKRRDQMSRFEPAASDYSELALNERLTTMLKAGDDITPELRRCCHANALALGFVPAPLPTS